MRDTLTIDYDDPYYTYTWDHILYMQRQKELLIWLVVYSSAFSSHTTKYSNFYLRQISVEKSVTFLNKNRNLCANWKYFQYSKFKSCLILLNCGLWKKINKQHKLKKQLCLNWIVRRLYQKNSIGERKIFHCKNLLCNVVF